MDLQWKGKSTRDRGRVHDYFGCAGPMASKVQKEVWHNFVNFVLFNLPNTFLQHWQPVIHHAMTSCNIPYDMWGHFFPYDMLLFHKFLNIIFLVWFFFAWDWKQAWTIMTSKFCHWTVSKHCFISYKLFIVCILYMAQL